MELLDNKVVTYHHTDEYLQFLIENFENELKKVEQNLGDDDEKSEDFYTQMVYYQFYALREQVKNLKRLRKDKLYEVYN